MAVDTARLLSEVSKSMTTIQQTLEKKILAGFIGADPTKISATAIKNLKNNVKISSGITGSSTKNVPNDVFTAFATMVSNDLAGSKIKKFETNDVKRTSQIASALKSGIKNEKNTISVNGTDYSIEYNIVAYAGIGVSSAHVRWKDKNRKKQHIILTWTNVGTQQGNQALAEYGSLLKDLDADLWKDFFKEVLKPGAKTWIVANYGGQILNAITDKVYAKNFLEDLGFYNKDIKAEKFGQFISDNVADGNEIISAAKLLKNLEKKQAALITAVNTDKKIESKLKAFTKTCNKLETKLGLEKSDFSLDVFMMNPVNTKSWESNIALGGTTDDDLITNYGGDYVTITSGAGNDSVYNNSGANVTISSGEGDDSLKNDFGKNVMITCGKGDDSVYNYLVNNVIIACDSGNDNVYTYLGNNVTIDGGKGDDSIHSIYRATVYGGLGKDTINVGAGYIDGGAGDDIIITSPHWDTTSVKGGKDDDVFYPIINDSIRYGRIFEYAKGDGNDTIYGFNSDDTLNITKGNYKVSTKNNDVIVKVGTGKIILKDAVGK